MKLRITALLCTLALLFSCVPVLAVSAEGEPTITVGSAEVTVRETVKVPVVMENNPNIMAFAIGFSYDTEILQLESVEFTAGLDGTFSYYKKAVWGGTQNSDFNGTLLTLTFTALAEGETEVTAVYDEGDICNYDEDDVNFDVIAGLVTVTKENVPTAQMVVGNGEAEVGGTVEVMISLVNNPGIMGFTLSFEYDKEILQLDSVELVADLGGTFSYSKRAVWGGTANTSFNGEVLKLTFTALKAGETEVTVVYEEGDICNYDEDDVNFDVVAGLVTVTGAELPEAQIVVGSGEAEVGGTVEVMISLVNNPGIMGFTLSFEYDKEILQLDSVELVADLGGTFSYSKRAVWGGTANTSFEGEILKLTFTALKAGVSEVTVVYEEGDICNYDEDDVNFAVVAGEVTVAEGGCAHTNTKDVPGVAATCCAEGYTDGVYCEDCETYVSGHEVLPIDPYNHTGDTYTDPATEPTCTEDGYTGDVHCADCDAVIERGTAIPASGHAFGEWTGTEPTCTEAGVKTRTCANCGETETETTSELGHDLTAHEAVEATHTSAGNIAYWTCERCGKCFSDAAATTEIAVADTEIPVIPHEFASEWSSDDASHWHACSCGEKADEEAHSFAWVIDKEATEDETGLKHEACSVCGATRNENTVIDKLDHVHRMEAVAETPATCTTDGVKAHYHCSACGKDFADEAGTDELTDLVIPATGHAFGEWTGTEPTCTEDGEKTRTCANCGLIETETLPATGHTLTEHEAVSAEHGAEGNIGYWSCEDCGKFYADEEATEELTEEEVVIPAIPHEFSEDWSSDDETHWHLCSCGEKGDEEAHSFVWVVDKEATETETGLQHEACAVCGFTRNENTVIDKLDHTHEMETVDEVPASCTTDGVKAHYHCSACGKDFADIDGTEELTDLTIPATGHVFGEWVTTDATCTADGEKVRTCANCGETESETIPATGHTFGEWTGTEPTCTADGVKTRSCANCDATETETTPATGHVFGEWETTDATCTVDGKKVRTCANCGETESETIPATGHTPGEWEVTKEPTETEEGEQVKKCLVCGEIVETESIAKLIGLIGDVNGDGAVNMVDYLLIKRCYLETIELPEDWEARADVDNSGAVDPIDYLLVKKFVLETLTYEDLLAARK